MFNVQELALAVQHRLAVTFVVFNDNAFGNVKRSQIEDYGNRVVASDLKNPDFVKLAESFGMMGMRAETPEALRPALRKAIASNEPVLIECPVGAMPNPFSVLRFLKPVRPKRMNRCRSQTLSARLRGERGGGCRWQYRREKDRPPSRCFATGPLPLPAYARRGATRMLRPHRRLDRLLAANLKNYRAAARKRAYRRSCCDCFSIQRELGSLSQSRAAVSAGNTRVSAAK